MGDEYSDMQKLSVFCAKHRNSLQLSGVYAFNLDTDVDKPMRDVIYIPMIPNPIWNGKSAETAFLATEIRVVPLEFFGEEEEKLRGYMRNTINEQRRVGYQSGYTVVLRDVCSGAQNVSGMSIVEGKPWIYPAEMGDSDRWKTDLLFALNAGIKVQDIVKIDFV